MTDNSEGSLNNDDLGGKSTSEDDDEPSVDDCLKELFKLARKMDAKHNKKVHRILSKAIDGLRELAKEDEEAKKKKKEKKKEKAIKPKQVETDKTSKAEEKEKPADTVISAAAELIQDVKAEIQGDPESLMERIRRKHEEKSMKMNRSMNLSSSQVNSDEEGSDLARLNALRKKREQRRKKKGDGVKIKRCSTIE